jgi:glycosyltransferase involved in cell wall biosynthesis
MSCSDQGHGRSRFAIVHDYFTQRGGAERVVERLAGLFTSARVFAAVVDPDALPSSFGPGVVTTTPLQRALRAGVPLQALAPVLPGAFGMLDLGSPDVVVSSSSAFAHHVRPPAGSVHVCYCHTPPRFLWEPDEYFREHRSLRRLGGPALGVLRHWDLSAAGRMTTYVANSAFTADRIRRVYGRIARIVHPPIETAAFHPSTDRSGRFLVVARLRPHKRVDLALAAANALRLPLDVIGDGSDLPRLRQIAGPTIRFLGRRTDPEVAAAMARCAGLLVPGVEDFGMTTAEVQAAGRPPIAFAAGGSPEIVRDGRTGFLFTDQSVAAIGEAMLRALREPIDPLALVESARRFDAKIFDAGMRELVAEAHADERIAAIGGPRGSVAALDAHRAAAAHDPVP